MGKKKRYQGFPFLKFEELSGRFSVYFKPFSSTFTLQLVTKQKHNREINKNSESEQLITDLDDIGA